LGAAAARVAVAEVLPLVFFAMSLLPIARHGPPLGEAPFAKRLFRIAVPSTAGWTRRDGVRSGDNVVRIDRRAVELDV
jgi:hypothetical protein